MPDPFHFLAEGIEPTSDLFHSVEILKIKSSRQYAAQPGGVLGQNKFYDHVLRALESVEPVAWHIWLNSVRKDLVERPHEYPFAGSCTGTDANGMEWVQLVSTMEETELPPSLIGKLVSVADRLRMRSLQNLPNLNRFLRFLVLDFLRPRHRFLHQQNHPHQSRHQHRRLISHRHMMQPVELHSSRITLWRVLHRHHFPLQPFHPIAHHELRRHR